MLLDALAAAYVDWVLNQFSHENKFESARNDLAATDARADDVAADTGKLYRRTRRGKGSVAGIENTEFSQYVEGSIIRSF